MISFFVPGIPKPAGSKKYVGKTKRGKAIIVDVSGTPGKKWRDAVRDAAKLYAPESPWNTGLQMDLRFVMPRPKSHYGTGRNAEKVKFNAPIIHTAQPDTTKLVRAVEDAMTGVVYRDDSLIVKQTAEKVYGEDPGVWIAVFKLERPYRPEPF